MSDEHITDIVGNIVSAYLAKNALEASQVPTLIRSVQDTLQQKEAPKEGAKGIFLGEPFKVPEGEDPVKATVFQDYIICLEDGQKLKMLKRHLETYYDLSPAQYRAKWKLPRDYPMVAPSYTETRSKIAKDLGLGKSRSKKRSSKTSTKKEQSAVSS